MPRSSATMYVFVFFFFYLSCIAAASARISEDFGQSSHQPETSRAGTSSQYGAWPVLEKSDLFTPEMEDGEVFAKPRTAYERKTAAKIF
uniref:Putative secreted protein n=1 Tax=Ixodes ricinus TaxID=34613 RepID=A0A6B0UCB7_IXORI